MRKSGAVRSQDGMGRLVTNRGVGLRLWLWGYNKSNAGREVGQSGMSDYAPLIRPTGLNAFVLSRQLEIHTAPFVLLGC